MADAGGMVTKMDFVRLGQDLKLMDFGGAMGEKKKPQTPRKERRGEDTEGGGKVSKKNVFLCIINLLFFILFKVITIFCPVLASHQPVLDVLLSIPSHHQAGGGECGQGAGGLQHLGH